MGLSTVTAARIMKGQLRGKKGEEEKLSFEDFPYVSLAKVINSIALKTVTFYSYLYSLEFCKAFRKL